MHSSIMKLNLYLLLSFSGIVSVTLTLDRHDYYLITTPKTWSDAQSYCQNNYDDLAIIKTADDWARLNNESARIGLPTTGWIGLSNFYWNWYWYDDGPLSKFPLENWAPGQPDNLGGNENCGAINESGYWADYPCKDLKPFICYDDILGYVPYPNSTKSWSGSLNYCYSKHKKLASSLNITMNDELQALALEQGISWVGLTRFAWWWVDLTYFTSAWSPGYPNNAELHNNCASVNNSLVVDKLCNSKFYFFCYTKYTLKYKVLKLQIRGDMRVFDPAVQAAILQQIIQKLKDHGISTQTEVKWRVYPDGTIFHKKSNDL